MRIKLFHVDHPNEYCKTCKDHGLKVQKTDLVIVCFEKYRLENELALNQAGTALPMEKPTNSLNNNDSSCYFP